LPELTTDPRWSSPDSYNVVERWLLRVLRDERDMVFLRTSARIAFTLFPIVGLLFLSPPWVVALAAVPYIAFLFLTFAARYGLMLHATGHRPIFRKEYRALDHVVPWVFGPFLGHTPTSFAAHHLRMHHAENNMLGDDFANTLDGATGAQLRGWRQAGR